MSSVHDQIAKEIAENKIMIYMKGTPEMPQCGFSKAVVDVFEVLEVPFASRDVLADPALRDGIKTFSEWPTIPQVFIDGKFIGGCDIIRDMYFKGELEPLVKAALKK
ncbi:MAG: Grx4 family monothiol glutaredoxin [Proteobacteria bacterium]|nr:Grx4 family monothiol glutaredoxin [Pseudomonadota bacterium]NDC25617.1 Grx4 family monothiol glutaredoxin [Pseudomonadota bacterium]NDD04884.1 Grx4 family monothiol glutaredoxin [Pseudomonadota bacterium]NDG26645.1 Grx4 family monothiol glutaredoxin [Pseudomonadota bacterium]